MAPALVLHFHFFLGIQQNLRKNYTKNEKRCGYLDYSHSSVSSVYAEDFAQTKMECFFNGINNTSWRKLVFRCHVINLYLKSLFSNKTTILTKIKLSIDVKFEPKRWTVLRKKKPSECPSCSCSKYLKLCGALCHTQIFVQASPFSK